MSRERIFNTLKSADVARYHAVAEVKPQTVGHHAWGVAVICMYLTGGDCTTILLREALLHDSAEYFTGDIPFTTKRENPDFAKLLKTMESGYRSELLLPELPLIDEEVHVLKIADTLEGAWWCLRNSTGTEVYDRWNEAFNKVTKWIPLLDNKYNGFSMRLRLLTGVIFP